MRNVSARVTLGVPTTMASANSPADVDEARLGRWRCGVFTVRSSFPLKEQPRCHLCASMSGKTDRCMRATTNARARRTAHDDDRDVYAAGARAAADIHHGDHAGGGAARAAHASLP